MLIRQKINECRKKDKSKESLPAGCPSHKHYDVPLNFAWNVDGENHGHGID